MSRVNETRKCRDLCNSCHFKKLFDMDLRQSRIDYFIQHAQIVSVGTIFRDKRKWWLWNRFCIRKNNERFAVDGQQWPKEIPILTTSVVHFAGPSILNLSKGVQALSIIAYHG